MIFLLVTCLAAVLGCSGAPKSAPNQTFLENMVLVPAGAFLMGQDTGASDPDETPQHEVVLGDFYIDRTEVTNAQFKDYCDATGRLYPSNPMWDADYFMASPNHPVINITYDQARGYCEWVGKRLPTEAEWEKAARGRDGEGRGAPRRAVLPSWQSDSWRSASSECTTRVAPA